MNRGSTMREEEKREHFKNALSNYTGVMDILDRFDDEGIVHNDSIELPGNWEQENLLLLGEYLNILDLTENEKRIYRKNTFEIIERNGAEYVWKIRRRLAAEIIFLRHF